MRTTPRDLKWLISVGMFIKESNHPQLLSLLVHAAAVAIDISLVLSEFDQTVPDRSHESDFGAID
jgi:hypothetical protein